MFERNETNVSRSVSARAFTLIELLVVVAIIGLLASIILATLSTARSKAAQAAAKQLDANFDHTIGDSKVFEMLFDDAAPGCSGNVTTAQDTSGGNHNGTGTVALGTTIPTWSTDTVSGTGCSVLFSNGGVRIGTISSLQITGDITIAAWIKPVSLAGYGVIIRQGQGGDESYGMSAGYYRNNALEFHAYNGNWGTSWVVGSANRVRTNVWQFVLATRKGTNIGLYVNGSSAGTGTIAMPTVTGGMLSIGGGDSGQPFVGYIDNVRIYDRALDAMEVEKLYAMDAGKHGLAFGGTYWPLR